MNDQERRLRDRLRRLERAMPSAVPIEPGGSVRHANRRRLLGIAAAALLAGGVLGVGGTLLLGPRSATPAGAPAQPEGLYRSSSPMAGPICAAIYLPIDSSFADLAWTRIWWWPTDGTDCGRRTDFVYVQWIQPERVQLVAGSNATRPGISLSATVEVRSGERYQFSFTLDPENLSTIAGALPTFADAGGRVAGTPFVPLSSFDLLQEVP